MALKALVNIEYSFPLAEWLAGEYAGGDSMAEICASHPGRVPGPLVVRRWRREFPAFDLVMQEAERARAEVLADQTISIADNPDAVPAMVGHQIRARQWLASRLDRNKWGEGSAGAGSGQSRGDGSRAYTDDELQEIIRGALQSSSVPGEVVDLGLGLGLGLVEEIKTGDPVPPHGEIDPVEE